MQPAQAEFDRVGYWQELCGEQSDKQLKAWTIKNSHLREVNQQLRMIRRR
jgi:hypothetical protein